MEFSKFNKVLIIRLSSLGDVLLITPMIRTLKQKYPFIKIDFLVRKEFVSALLHNPHLNEIISIPRDYDRKQYRSEILKNNYDLIIDLQNNIRSRLLTRKSVSPIVRYKKPYLHRFMLVKFKINRFSKIDPIPVRYSNSIPDFSLDNKGLELFLPPDLMPKLTKNEKYIGLCPGAKHRTKMWPKEYYIKLGQELSVNNYKIVLFGGKDDLEICSEISKQIENSINLSNNNDLFELAANMKNCDLLICNDSGLMHTGLAVGTPVISIFGSSVKEFGFAPYKGKNLVLENNSLSCRPCSHIGRDKCPKEHLNCLNEISPEYVLSETINLLERI